MQWYLKVLGQYVDFAGRARRKEYWMFTLVSVVISIVLAIIDSALFEFQIGVLGLLYSLAVLLPTLAVSVRRLHDTGRTGWWVLIALIPIIGTIVLIVFMVMDGERHPNAYGPDPKAIAGDAAPAI